MRKKIVEGSVLFISILKWLFLATCVGVMVGVSTTVFLKLLERGSSAAAGFPHYYFLLPIAFLASSILVKYLAPDAEGHGTEKIIEAVHKYSGKINRLEYHRPLPISCDSVITTAGSWSSAALALGSLRFLGRR